MKQPKKPEVFEMEISGLKQKVQRTSSYIIAELHYDDGEKKIFTMKGSRLGETAIKQFIAHVFTHTHKHGEASGIETFLDAMATTYLQGKLF